LAGSFVLVDDEAAEGCAGFRGYLEPTVEIVVFCPTLQAVTTIKSERQREENAARR
jgi:hypothetical protein